MHAEYNLLIYVLCNGTGPPGWPMFITHHVQESSFPIDLHFVLSH